MKITKKLIGKAGRVYVSDSYISNGAWVVSRQIVDNSKEYTPAVISALGNDSNKVMTDSQFETAAQFEHRREQEPFIWTRAAYVLDRAEYYIFADKLGRTVWFDRDYVEALGISEVFPTEDSLTRCFVNYSSTIAIMPVKKLVEVKTLDLVSEKVEGHANV